MTRIGSLLNDIQYVTGYTIEQIADEIHYSREHLGKLAKKGDSKGVYEALNRVFGEKIQNVILSRANSAAINHPLGSVLLKILANQEELLEVVKGLANKKVELPSEEWGSTASELKRDRLRKGKPADRGM